MGLLGKLIAAKATTKVVQKLNERNRAAQAADYIPAGSVAATTGSLATRGTAIADRAGRFYRENPKLVASVGVAVAAMVLSRLTQKRF